MLNSENTGIALFKLCIIIALFLPAPAFPSDRIALVIGNSAYDRAPLANPTNDAQAISEAFQSMGYATVLTLLNGNRNELEIALDTFNNKAAAADIAVVYYAGHGIQVSGENYLIPVDVDIKNRRDIRKLTPLKELTEVVSTASKLGLVILDACRDNPFAATLDGETGRGLVGRGLTLTRNTQGSTLIAYATESDRIAEDGNGRHSPYTEALLSHLKTPDLDIRLMFGRVRDEVIEKTRNRQRPFVYGSLGGERYFLPSKAVQTNLTNRLTDTQIKQASDRFRELQQAIEVKDLNRIQQLTRSSEARNTFFSYLFNNFENIHTTLNDLSINRDSSSVAGRLEIKKLTKSNGDIGHLSPSFRNISLTAAHANGTWSSIEW